MYDVMPTLLCFSIDKLHSKPTRLLRDTLSPPGAVMSACIDGFHFVVLDNLVKFVVHCHVAQLMGSYAWTFHRGPEQLGEYVWHWDLRTRAASVVANGFIIVRSLSALCFPVACVDR